MRIYKLNLAYRTGHTWRRHVPVWFGLLRHGTADEAKLNGVYVRFGHRSLLLESDRPYELKRREFIDRLGIRVTLLEHALRDADVPIPKDL